MPSQSCCYEIVIQIQTNKYLFLPCISQSNAFCSLAGWMERQWFIKDLIYYAGEGSVITSLLIIPELQSTQYWGTLKPLTLLELACAVGAPGLIQVLLLLPWQSHRSISFSSSIKVKVGTKLLQWLVKSLVQIWLRCFKSSDSHLYYQVDNLSTLIDP